MHPGDLFKDGPPRPDLAPLLEQLPLLIVWIGIRTPARILQDHSCQPNTTFALCLWRTAAYCGPEYAPIQP